jgi:hypothetical protein
MKKLRYSNGVTRISLCFLLASSALLIACASSSAEPVGAKANFNGGWSIKWCDKKNPKLDCGGFNITLIQEGDRICGDFGGALVNLRQIDEGTIVGTAVGNTAVLAVESNRNGSISLVRAKVNGNSLQWNVVDQVRRGDNNDIDIIATDDILTKDHPPSLHLGKRLKAKLSCNSFRGSTES